MAGQLFIPNSPPALQPVIESAVGIRPNYDQGIMEIFYRKFFLIRKRPSFPIPCMLVLFLCTTCNSYSYQQTHIQTWNIEGDRTDREEK